MSQCCAWAGIPSALLAFEEDSLWVPRLDEFNRCTGAKITLTFTAEGEDGMQAALEQDVGVSYDSADGSRFVSEGAGVYDGYVLAAPWVPKIVDGLENMSPRISETPSLDWLDVNPTSRELFSFDGTVRALPLDTDYISLGWRADVYERYDMQPPETIDELVAQSEFLNGKDHNGDGVADWGYCLTPQPNYFYAFVAPLLHLSRRHDGQLTGDNLFFDVRTFEPKLGAGFRHALQLHDRFLRASNCQHQLDARRKCDRKSAMRTGRCAGVISMPGTMTKLLKPWDRGGTYAPQPRYASDGSLAWEVAANGSYWGRRKVFPGSAVVEDPSGVLVNCTRALCPKAVAHPRTGQLVNYAPFFAEGGEAYALRGGSPTSKKDILWGLFRWFGTLPPSKLPLSGAYRLSHLGEEAKADLLRDGWPEQMADDLCDVLRFAFKDDDEGGNGVQDLLVAEEPEDHPPAGSPWGPAARLWALRRLLP